MSDLEKIESKIVDQMTSKFESFHGKFDRFLSLFSAQNSDSVLRRSGNNVDSGTSGERRPLNTGRNDTLSGRGISLNNGLDRDFGLTATFQSVLTMKRVLMLYLYSQVREKDIIWVF